MSMDECARCGEHIDIYIKPVYSGPYGKDVWVAECHACGNMVSTVAHGFEAREKVTAAWNAQEI